MSTGYQVIARRWRPQQFDEVVGQDHIMRTLKNAIEQERIAHAYLFVGPRGTGKTTTARLFAKALNCEDGPKVNPPLDSPICQAIMNGSCMDVIEIDGASNNSVDQVRQLREDCQYAPSQGQFKIYIIDEVHMLSNAAFNALLKTLEEPPSHVKFIFATTEAQKVLATIVSRCQRFEFRPIPDEIITQKLALIAEKEEINVDAQALASIAHLANGGMRDAQSILDQLISFCGSNISEKDVLDVYGLASAERIEALGKALATADHPALINLVDELAGEGRDLYRVLVDLQAFVRKALLDAIRNGGNSGLLGSGLSSESLMRLLDSLHEGESAVKLGLSEKVNFEITLLKAVEASRARAIDSLIKELSGMAQSLPEESGKKKLTEQAPAAPEPKTAPVSEPEKAETVADDEPPDPEPYLEDMGNGQDMEAVASRVEEERTRAPEPDTMEPAARVPTLESLIEKVPESTRKILDEEFRGHFREVRRVKQEKLF